MSADLFAEFGTSQTPQQQSSGVGSTGDQPTQTFGFFNDLAQPQPPTQQFGGNKVPTVDDTDDWGGFEGVSSFEPEPKQQNLFPSAQPSQIPHTSWQTAPIPKSKKPSNPNVLFDAEADNDDDDDFGDFEGGESYSDTVPPKGGSTGLEDLMNNVRVSQSKPNAPSQTKDLNVDQSTKRNPNTGFGSVSRSKQTSTTSSSSIAEQEDSWETFDEWEASIPSTAPPKRDNVFEAPSNSKISNLTQSGLSPTFAEPQPGELPPTNVPPPGVLLSLFPPVFADAQNKLFKPMASQPLPMRNKLLSEPGAITYLRGYLMLASVAARIIAGRKLRWKRDMHLSQGMRIGPASSRSTSGMKLTGIDKSEAMKEEREVSDVVRVWRDQLGRLRHVVSAANQIKASSLGSIPEMQETMPVRTLKQAEGGVPATQPCMLCGLKREERVNTVDQSVEDSFGEWWVEQVNMHRACRNFWQGHKDALRQR